MKQCPRCSLRYPPEVTVCPCGFDLVNGDARAVRGVLKRRGRLYVAVGLSLIAFGVVGGTSLISNHASFFVTLTWFKTLKIDILPIMGGLVFCVRGIRIIGRPWTEKSR